MFKQISTNETNMSMAVKKSSAESMVVKLVLHDGLPFEVRCRCEDRYGYRERYTLEK